MVRPRDYRERVVKTLNFEKNVYEEYEELCFKERISVSKKLQEFMSEQIQIQKNALGLNNPIGVGYTSYNIQAKKRLGSTTTLDEWARRKNAIQLIKRIDENMAENAAINIIIASRFKKTGVYRDVKVI